VVKLWSIGLGVGTCFEQGEVYYSTEWADDPAAQCPSRATDHEKRLTGPLEASTAGQQLEQCEEEQSHHGAEEQSMDALLPVEA